MVFICSFKFSSMLFDGGVSLCIPHFSISKVWLKLQEVFVRIVILKLQELIFIKTKKTVLNHHVEIGFVTVNYIT